MCFSEQFLVEAPSWSPNEENKFCGENLVLSWVEHIHSWGGAIKTSGQTFLFNELAAGVKLEHKRRICNCSIWRFMQPPDIWRNLHLPLYSVLSATVKVACAIQVFSAAHCRWACQYCFTAAAVTAFLGHCAHSRIPRLCTVKQNSGGNICYQSLEVALNCSIIVFLVGTV